MLHGLWGREAHVVNFEWTAVCSNYYWFLFREENGPVVNSANAFHSRLRGDWVPLGSSPTKSQKKKNQTVIVSCLTSGTEQARRSFYLGQWTQRYKTPHLSNAMLNYLAKAWKKWNSYTSHSQDNKSETSRIIDEKFSHERNFEWNILPEKKPPPKSLKTTWSKACQDNKWVTLRSRRNSPQSRSETKNIRLGGSGFRINHTWAAPNGVLCTDWSETWSLKCEHSFLSRGGRGLSAET